MLQECGVVQQNLIYGKKMAKNKFHSIARYINVLGSEAVGEGAEHSHNIALMR